MKRILRYLLLPISKDEDIARREYILNVLLIGVVLFSTLIGVASLVDFYIYTLYNIPITGGSPIMTILFVLLFWSLLILLKKGFYYIVAYAFIGTLFVASLYSLFSWGVVNAQGLLLLVFVIIMSGVVVGTRMAFGILIISFFTLFVLSYLQINSILETDISKNGILGYGDTTVYVVTLAVIALVAWLFNKEIEKSLARARKSEMELKEEKNLLEQRVEKRTAELKKAQLEKTIHLYKFAEYGRITSGLLHDISNPLMSVLLNLEDLKRNGNSENLPRINKAVKNIDRIKNIITSGREQIQEQEVNTYFSIDDEVARVLQMLSFKAKKVGVVFDVMPYSPTKINGNQLKFYRLMVYLVSNAIDSYEHIFNSNDRKVLIAFCKKGHLVRIMVQDWGIGIKEEHKDEIFKPFFTTKSLGEGTGIGLSICKEITEKDFNGNLSVKSKVGEGSTFVVDIPV